MDILNIIFTMHIIKCFKTEYCLFRNKECIIWEQGISLIIRSLFVPRS